MKSQSDFQKSLIEKIHCLENDQSLFKQCFLKEIQTLKDEIKGLRSDTLSSRVHHDNARENQNTQINVPVWMEKN